MLDYLTPAEEAAYQVMQKPNADLDNWAAAVVAAVYPIIAAEVLRAERKAILDHKAKLLADRTRLGQRFEGRLLGLEEAAGKLTTAIKALRSNEKGNTDA